MAADDGVSRSDESGPSVTAMTEPTEVRFKPGDVLRYLPDDRFHCAQGTAIVRPDGAVVDTYWGENGYGGESHWLTDKELASADFQFNVNDYEQIGTIGHCRPRNDATWLTYHPDDRGRIGSQGPHCAVLYVRKGSKPDLETRISNAQAEVEEAEWKLRSAESRLRFAREDLAKLEAQRP